MSPSGCIDDWLKDVNIKLPYAEAVVFHKTAHVSGFLA